MDASRGFQRCKGTTFYRVTQEYFSLLTKFNCYIQLITLLCRTIAATNPFRFKLFMNQDTIVIV